MATAAAQERRGGSELSRTARQFEARDPDFERRVRSSFARQQLMRFIGAEISSLSPGRCEIRLPYREELSQQHGYFHGGVIGMVADSAGGYAAYTLMPADSSVLTVEYKMNLLAPGDGDLLVADGHVLKAGRNLVISRAEVYVFKGGREAHCATMQQTLMTMHGRVDEGPAAVQR
jgi:uncharacterized protein (TIGR00369 family)